MNTPTKGRHIAGIDGLRAISVLAVIAFHYFSGFESAGYLGVDVFFVISGFVITASIASYEAPNSLKEFAVKFYLRRFKRLLPALFAVVIFTSIMVMLVTTEGQDNLRTGALALVGGANIFLYIKEADYFALTSELNPFTHMWSLAVEDQFYLLFPFLLWGCAFFSIEKSQTSLNKLLMILGVISFASLVTFIAFFKFDYSFSFYMMPTRLWQIGSGILIYLLASRTNTLLALKNVPLFIPVLILLGTLLFGHHSPLVAHIVVTVATAFALAILWFSQEKANFLGHGIPAYVGKISYSLYLWHWPFLVLAKHTIGTSPLVISMCLLLTFIFAASSYHFVEQPVRYAKISSLFAEQEKLFQKVLTGVIASVLVLYIGVSRYAPKENNLLAKALDVAPVLLNSRHRCHGIKALKKFESPLTECLGAERTTEKPNKGLPARAILMQISTRKFWKRYWKKHHTNFNSSMLRAMNKGSNFVSNLMKILPAMEQKGVKFLFMYDTPLMASVTTVQSCAIQTKLGGSNICTVTRKQDVHSRMRQEQAFEKLRETIPGITVWDPLPTIYKDSLMHDVMDGDEDYLMYDWSHISDKLAKELQLPLKSELDKLLHGDLIERKASAMQEVIIATPPFLECV
ncbi:O-acetyltransferase OatA [Nymphon striatum]|nr:O-acetyltransferase OatA [Nymphon striatum]